MRKNRSALRAKISEPLIQKRQEFLSIALKKGLEEKKGKSILNLKNVFEKETNSSVDKSAEIDIEEDNEEKDEKVDSLTVEKKVLKKLAIKNKLKETKYQKKNPTKELVWLK